MKGSRHSVVFVAIVVAVFAIGGSTPGEHDGAKEVQALYEAHHSKHINLAFAIAIPFALFFASALRHDLRCAGGTGQLAFAGGALTATGLAFLASVHLALANAGGNANTIATAQTLNVLDNIGFIPVATGLAVLVFAGGLSAIHFASAPDLAVAFLDRARNFRGRSPRTADLSVPAQRLATPCLLGRVRA